MHERSKTACTHDQGSARSRPIAPALALVLMCALLAGGCARAPRDSEYRLLVDVITHPPGASFLGPGRTPYVTPAQIAIREGHSLTIVLKKEGYEPYRVKLAKRNRPRNRDTANPIFWEQALVFMTGREAYRSASGANAILAMAPNPVNVDLTPIDGSLPSYPSEPISIDAGDLSCERPIELTQDCVGSRRAEPVRRIHVRGLDVRIAASETGHEVLVTHDDVNVVALGLFPEGYGPDACTRVMREAHGLGPKLLHLTAIEANGVTHGCYLEFDGNVYGALKTLTLVE